MIRGTGEDQPSLLERVGRHVVDAAEELGTLILGSAPLVANEIVVPVIVTNASLYACPVDPQRISLDEGKLSDARFSKVPYIRFRKTLAQRFTEYAAPKSVKEADADRKRTVFVINSEKLTQFLAKWDLAEIPAWPGELLPRQQAL